MIANFTVIDILGTIKAMLAMALFVFVPGYVLGAAVNVFGFRRRRLILKLLLSILLAISCFPVLTYLLERYVPHSIFVFYGIVWAAFVVLVVREVRRGKFALGRPSKAAWLCVAAVILWLIVGTGSLVDLQIHDRLYFSVPAYDYSVRTAFTSALARSFPPENPFFASSPPVLLRYHYFWMLSSGLVVQLVGVSPRTAIFAGTLWCGLGLMALLAVYLKFFLREQSRIERKTLIGIALLLVTGLDILPTAVLAGLRPHKVLPDMEWWNAPQITSWLDSMIWVPHHLAALISCLFGFLILHSDRDSKPATKAVLGSLAFASAAGLSVYVTFTFALFMGAWVVIVASKKLWKELRVMLATGAFAGILAAGFLYSLAGPAGGHGFVNLAMRKFSFATDLLARYGHGGHTTSAPASILLLPLNYILELGFFLLVGIHRLVRLRRREIEWTPQELAGWTLVGASFFVGTFMRSTLILNNDLGFRCFLFAQFVLLLWAVPLVENFWFGNEATGTGASAAHARRWKLAAVACAVLGVIGTAYQVVNLRLYPILADRPHQSAFRQDWLDGDGQLGKRTYALRAAYDRLNADLANSAVVQFNPIAPGFLPDLLYNNHPAVAVGQQCGTVFGGNLEDCPGRLRGLAGVYGKSNALSGPQVDELCSRMGIDIVIAKDTDKVWADRASWVWQADPLVANEYVRAFRCKPATAVSAVSAPNGHGRDRHHE